MSSTRSENMTKVAAILDELYGIPRETVLPEATFRGTFQMDSMDIIAFIEELEHVFEIPRGSTSLDAYRAVQNVQELLDFVENHKKGS